MLLCCRNITLLPLIYSLRTVLHLKRRRASPFKTTDTLSTPRPSMPLLSPNISRTSAWHATSKRAFSSDDSCVSTWFLSSQTWWPFLHTISQHFQKAGAIEDIGMVVTILCVRMCVIAFTWQHVNHTKGPSNCQRAVFCCAWAFDSRARKLGGHFYIRFHHIFERRTRLKI